MEARATTISENSVFAVPRGMLGEWGLSVLVERDDRKVLLDTGGNIAAAHNGDLLGIAWNEIDAMVLSHGHYDHTGGLLDVLPRIGKRIRVIAHPDVFADKVAQYTPTMTPLYIGIPYKRAELEALGADFHLTGEPVWLSENVVTSGEVPMITDFESIDPGCASGSNGDVVPDPLRDDQAIFVKTGAGAAGDPGLCPSGHHQHAAPRAERHRGGQHTLRHRRHPPSLASELQMEMTVAALRELGVERLGVSHCTGMPAAIRLAQEFGPGFFFNNSGSVVAV